MSDSKEDLWNGIGVSMIILSILLGMGGCSHLIDSAHNSVDIEKEKTKQLQLQIQLQRYKNDCD